MAKKSDAWDAVMGNRRSGKYPANSVGWILGQYRQSPEYTNLAASTKVTYEQAFDRLHDKGGLDITGLRRRHILAIRDELSDTPGVANSVLTALAVICRYALDRDIIEMDPTRGVSRLKTGEFRRWTDAEIERFYTETYEALRRVLVLGLFTGQRRSDLCKALWSDLDGCGIRVVQQKTGAKLFVPLHPILATHLAEWRRTTTTVTILAHSDQRPWRPLILSQAFSNECAALGMAGCTIHGLRKTAAAKLAEAGCSTRQIMSITGHASLTEVERYTREAEQRMMAESAMERLIVEPFNMICNQLKR